MDTVYDKSILNKQFAIWKIKHVYKIQLHK